MSDWDSDQADWGKTAPVEPRNQKDQGEGGQVSENSKEWKLIEKTLLSMQTEQRRSRRWGIFFKSLVFIYLFSLLFLFRAPMDTDAMPSGGKPHTALIDLRGPIAEEQDASADNLATALRRAFEAERSKGIILRINSPGGSPVQADYVYSEIKRLREKHPEKKLYAVISDLGASGAYYVAAAADEIFVNQSSLVGSIGVMGGGFGFTDAMDKLGIERRLYTAGENKAFLDPFSPEDEEHVEFWEQALETTHQTFIQRVKDGRGDRLADNDELFSGLVWTGSQAIDLGLVDDFGSAGHVARDVIGEEEIVDYTHHPSPFQRLLRQLGTSVGQGISRALLDAGQRLY